MTRVRKSKPFEFVDVGIERLGSGVLALRLCKIESGRAGAIAGELFDTGAFARVLIWDRLTGDVIQEFKSTG